MDRREFDGGRRVGGRWLALAGGLALLLGLAAGAAAADPPARLTNDLGMEFVLLPPGEFLMGSPEGEPGRDPDEAAHRVRLTRPFYLQTTEVTLGQWRALMGQRAFAHRHGRYDLPASGVSFHDAGRFIQQLNAMKKGTYRLPSEAEWEYACRAGGATPFSFGSEADCAQAMYANNPLKDRRCLAASQARGIAPGGPAPVKSYPASPWGLFDLHGNLWEWCADWYAPYPAGEGQDPVGPADGSFRVRRGGSFFAGPERMRSANRNYADPASRYATTGFRLVREVTP